MPAFERDPKHYFCKLSNALYREIAPGPTLAGVHSLQSALRAYCSTYQSLRGWWSGLWRPDPADYSFETNEFIFPDGSQVLLTDDFVHLSPEVILGLHHFFELATKDFLRGHNPALASIMPERPEDVFQSIEDSGAFFAKQSLRSLEFDAAFKRLSYGIKQNVGQLGDLRFLLDAEKCLTELAVLRNRVWHRGTVFLGPVAMDTVMTDVFLPLVAQVLGTNLFGAVRGRFTRGVSGGTRFSPFEELCRLPQAAHGRNWKTAFLKECGRALFQLGRKEQTRDFRERLGNVKNISEEVASLHDKARNRYLSFLGPIQPPRVCPVCGKKTLVSDMEDDFHSDDPDERGDLVSRWVYRVECFECSFMLDHSEFEGVGEYLGVNIGELFKQLVPTPPPG